MVATLAGSQAKCLHCVRTACMAFPQWDTFFMMVRGGGRILVSRKEAGVTTRQAGTSLALDSN